MIKEGLIITITAPSGTGKSSLIKKLKQSQDLLQESVSYTTRAKRDGELDGVDYFFIKKEDFCKMRDEGEFIEWAKVHGHFYGTSKKYVNEQLDKGSTVLFDLDVQGADKIKKLYGSLAYVIFMAPPSLGELEKRLRLRGTEKEDVIQLRLSNAKKELLRKSDYDYLVINDDFEGTLLELEKIIVGLFKKK